MNFLRQLYERRTNAYEISIDDILDKPAKAAIGKYMDDKFGVTLGDALDAIAGGPIDFDKDDQKTIIQDAKDGNKAAIYYCFYRCYNEIIRNYKMFMGSNPQMIAKRLSGDLEGKEAYITYAYLALAGDFSDIKNAKLSSGVTRTTSDIKSLGTYIGLSSNALELFDFDKDKSVTPFAGLAKVFKGCLQTIIRTYIPLENSGGINYSGEVTKAELTSGFSDKTASLVSMDKEIDDEHSGAKTVGEKISAEAGGYKGVEDEIFEKEDLDEALTAWINFCMKEPSLYQVIKKKKSGPVVITAFDDFTDTKRPIFPCDVLKAYIKAIDINKGAASQAHVNEELKKVLGVDKLQPMQWKATGHNVGLEDTPNEVMIKAIKAHGFTAVQLATLIAKYGANRLISFIDDQLED